MRTSHELPPAFEFVRELGQGCFGVVLLTRHRTLNRLVAVKRISAAAVLDPDAVPRFEREARALAAAQHPNVVLVFDLVRHEGSLLLVMEYLPGTTLQRHIRTPTSGCRPASGC